MLKLALTISCALCIAGAILHTTVALAAVEGSNNAANANAQTNIQPSIQIVLSKQKDSAIRMEIRQAPLGQVLKALAEKTGALIHYSALPEAPVTATCVGANVGQVMDCLVAKQVGLVAHKPQQGRPAEFWLLGSSVGSCQAVTIEQALIHHPSNKEDLPAPVVEKIDKSLQKLKSQNPDEREKAIAELIRIGQSKDPRIAQAIKTSMIDPDAKVRVKTVATLAREEGEYGATETIQKALEDTDSSVRLQAVDSIRENIEMLQQATNDADELVRSLAQTKLDAINNRKSKRQ